MNYNKEYANSISIQRLIIVNPTHHRHTPHLKFNIKSRRPHLANPNNAHNRKFTQPRAALFPVVNVTHRRAQMQSYKKKKKKHPG